MSAEQQTKWESIASSNGAKSAEQFKYTILKNYMSGTEAVVKYAIDNKDVGKLQAYSFIAQMLSPQGGSGQSTIIYQTTGDLDLSSEYIDSFKMSCPADVSAKYEVPLQAQTVAGVSIVLPVFPDTYSES